MRHERPAHPCDLLGVPRHADVATIQRAYRRLALRHHPDRDPSPGAAERFRLLNQAYRKALAPAARQPDPAAAPATVTRPMPRTAPRGRPATRGERMVFRALHATGLCFAIGLLTAVCLAFALDRGLTVQLMMALPGLAILPDSLEGLRMGTTKAGR